METTTMEVVMSKNGIQSFLDGIQFAVRKRDTTFVDFDKVPHWNVNGESCDLVCYPVFTGEMGGQYISTVVTFDVMEWLGITESEIFHLCQESAGRFFVRSINSMISEMTGMPESALPETPLCVITNKCGLYGAGAVAFDGILNKAMQEFNCDSMVVVPSSIHEVLCCPMEFLDEISEILLSVNGDSNLLQEKDILSDHVYVWDGVFLRDAGSEEFDVFSLF